MLALNMSFPYTYISCPCTDVSTPINGSTDPNDDEEQERTFDPRSPRANFSLYTLEHLLFCEDCQQIRCPRCTLEEIVTWYCPNCLFEMPSSMVKSEAGRCTRNCFNCPICIGPLAVTSIHPDPVQRSLLGPWILSCGYCNWTSLEIGWQFKALQDIRSEMGKLKIGGQYKAANSKSSGPTSPTESTPDDEPDSVFTALRSFYNSQLSASNATDPLLTPSGGINYSSPSSLARIMSLYTGRSSYGKKDQAKSTPMRESVDASEGLRIFDPASDTAAVEKLRTQGWTSTASTAQQKEQKHPPRFTSDLRPTQAQLRTKRSKRCRTCRHILVKPEAKVQSTRFRIRLVALNYIPTITLKLLQPSPSTQLPLLDLNALPVLRASQFLLTLKNPLFDPVKITLGTPAHTPGKHSHKVTILCPQFDIGPNADQWDEALGDNKNRRASKLLSTSKIEYVGGERGKVAEAGKVWEKGRNWTTVVVEVVCQDVEEAGEGDDVLEIPIFLRMEWEGDTVEREEGGGRSSAGGDLKGEEKKEKRELAFWVVVGVGRVGRLEGPPLAASP